MDATDDERLRRLQRLAFGADASTDERQAALDELDQLGQRDAAAADEARAASPADSSDHAVQDLIVDDPDPPPAPRRAKRLALRVGIITGTVAVVVGVVAGFAVGWQANPSQRTSTTASTASPGPVNAGPRLHADVFAAMPMALETEAAHVFDRPRTSVDTPVLETPLTEVTSLSGTVVTRLLATSSNGVVVFAARDATDLCLIAVIAEGGAASVCTQRGRFPSEGLSMSVSMGGPDVVVDVAWSPDGVLHLTPPH